MQYLELKEVLYLHKEIINHSGGSDGIRELSGVLSAIAQPRMTFGQEDLYSTIEEKAAAICFSLVMNHPFIDGNKRIGHAVMEAFLMLNGFEIDANIDEAEKVFLELAAGEYSRENLVKWIASNMKSIS